MNVFRKSLVLLPALPLLACQPASNENSASEIVNAAAAPRVAAYWQARNEFRRLALTVLRSLDRPCSFSRKGDRFHARAEVREQLDRLRALVARGAYGEELRSAQAQVEAERSSAVYECANPDRPGTDELIRQADAHDLAAIRRMLQLARHDS